METLKYNTRSAQENTAVSDGALVDEIDYLLSLYKIALDGGVWEKQDPIFDHVQDVEYELAPESEFPIIPVDDNAPAKASDEQTEEQLTSSIALPTKADGFIRQYRKSLVIGASALCTAIILLIVLGVLFDPVGKFKDTDTLPSMSSHDTSADSTKADDAFSSRHEDDYQHAVALMEAGKYSEAIPAFQKLGSYKDSEEKISECYYRSGTSLMESGSVLQALDHFSKAGDYKDAPAQAAALRKLYQNSLRTPSISAGRYHTAALKSDGTVVFIGSNEYYQQDLGPQWTDLVAICVGETHTVGLKSNGAVVHAGAINRGQRAVTEWWDIIAISSERNHIVGLKVDGTVVATGGNDHGQCDVWYWSDIVAISTGICHTAGLKSDGTAVATGKNLHHQCDVSTWTDIIAIRAGDSHTVGLKSDGTVVATGYNAYGQCDLSDWENIVDIGIGTAFTVGLRADGTVVAAGYPYGDLDQVSTWKDIVSISVSASHVAGLKSDGTIVTVNYDSSEQAAISQWTDIKLPE